MMFTDRTAISSECMFVLDKNANDQASKGWYDHISFAEGVQQLVYFGPAPWGPGEGSKGQVSLISITLIKLGRGPISDAIHTKYLGSRPRRYFHVFPI